MRVLSAVLAAVALALVFVYGVRQLQSQEQALPTVTVPPELQGVSCAVMRDKARELSAKAPQKARDTYYAFLSKCSADVGLPDALMELGAVLVYRLQRPEEARLVYAEALRRFPQHEIASDALFYVARLELDAGDYPSAVLHLNQLVTLHPGTRHLETAKFLAERAEVMRAANQSSQQTLVGQLESLVPSSAPALLLLICAVGTAVINAFLTWHRNGRSPLQTIALVAAVACLLANYALTQANRAESDRRLKAEIAEIRSGMMRE